MYIKVCVQSCLMCIYRTTLKKRGNAREMPNVKFYNYREEKTETLSEYKEEMEKTHSKYAKLRQEVTLI